MDVFNVKAQPNKALPPPTVALVALLTGLGGLIYGWAFASHQVSDYRD